MNVTSCEGNDAFKDTGEIVGQVKRDPCCIFHHITSLFLTDKCFLGEWRKRSHKKSFTKVAFLPVSET